MQNTLTDIAVTCNSALANMTNIKYIPLVSFALMSVLILMHTPVHADENLIVLTKTTSQVSLGSYLKILEDRHGDLTINQVSSYSADYRFFHHKNNTPSFGYTESVYWAKMTIKSECSKECEWFLELNYPLMDRFSIFIENTKGTFDEKKYGTHEHFSGRTYRHRNPIIPIKIHPGETSTIYLRFQNKDRMEFPLTLWSPAALNDNIYYEQFILGIYYGILLVMFIYNLFLFFSLKDISYFHYIVYILAMGIFQLGQNGYLYQLLSYLKDPPPVHFITLTQAFFIFAIINFSQSYLNTLKRVPLLHKMLNVLKVSSIIYVTFPFFIDYTVCIIIGVAFTFIMIPLIITTGTLVMMQGYRPANYFMAAWSAMFIVGFIFLFRVIALIPHNMLTNNILHLGTSIEVILWSIGLGDRYNLIKKEQDRMSEEMHIAHQIHGTLIPDKIPEFRGIKSYSEYIPMDEVGGDLFDYHIINDHCIGIMIADVAGHSIPAAIVASMVKVAFSLQIHNAADPVKVMYGMTDILKNKIRDTFITAGYVFLDIEKKELQYAKCGHLPLYIYKTNEMKLHMLEPKGRLICELEMGSIKMTSMPISSGDRIVMLTDGIIETINKKNQIFGFQRFEDFITDNINLDVKDFSHRLIRTLKRWMDSKDSFDDDITLVVVDIV